jgi:hypothetical protein
VTAYSFIVVSLRDLLYDGVVHLRFCHKPSSKLAHGQPPESI